MLRSQRKKMSCQTATELPMNCTFFLNDHMNCTYILYFQNRTMLMVILTVKAFHLREVPLHPVSTHLV